MENVESAPACRWAPTPWPAAARSPPLASLPSPLPPSSTLPLTVSARSPSRQPYLSRLPSPAHGMHTPRSCTGTLARPSSTRTRTATGRAPPSLSDSTSPSAKVGTRGALSPRTLVLRAGCTPQPHPPPPQLSNPRPPNPLRARTALPRLLLKISRPIDPADDSESMALSALSTLKLTLHATFVAGGVTWKRDFVSPGVIK